MADLVTSQCQRIDKGSPALNDSELSTLLDKVQHWQLSNDKKNISRRFDFKNYYETIAFVNAAAWIVHQQDHHPDLEVSYNRCNVIFSTHSVGGLSRNDFICAARFNALLVNEDKSK